MITILNKEGELRSVSAPQIEGMVDRQVLPPRIVQIEGLLYTLYSAGCRQLFYADSTMSEGKVLDILEQITGRPHGPRSYREAGD